MTNNQLRIKIDNDVYTTIKDCDKFCFYKVIKKIDSNINKLVFNKFENINNLNLLIVIPIANTTISFINILFKNEKFYNSLVKNVLKEIKK